MQLAGELHNELLEHARALVAELEAGNQEAAYTLLDAMGRQRDKSLYYELGKLARELHDSMNGFISEAQPQQEQNQGMSGAGMRAGLLVSRNVDAASRALDAIEISLPLAEELQERARLLQGRCAVAGALGTEVDAFLGLAGEHAGRMHEALSEARAAQNKQHLTGRALARVIGLVQEVESGLLDLICLPGDLRVSKETSVESTASQDTGEGKGEIQAGHDEVDELLSRLGF